MRVRLAGLVMCSIDLGCARATTPPPTPPSVDPVAPTTAAEAPSEQEEPAVSIGQLVDTVELVGPGGDEVWTEDGPAAAACEDENHPETLDTEVASHLGPFSLGAQLSILHPRGLAEPSIVSVHCHPSEGEDDPAMAQLKLSLTVPSRERGLGLTHESYLMVAGVPVNPKAGLWLPEAETEIEATARATLLAVATEETAGIEDECQDVIDTGKPLPPLTDGSLVDLQSWSVEGPDGTGNFVRFSVERCEWETTLGVLLDADGKPAKQWSTNNDVELLWITDLDGDGNDELGLRLTWLEDGMEEVSIEYREDGTWKTRALYVSESP